MGLSLAMQGPMCAVKGAMCGSLSAPFLNHIHSQHKFDCGQQCREGSCSSSIHSHQ